MCILTKKCLKTASLSILMSSSSNEREVYRSDPSVRSIGISLDNLRVPQKGLIFTAYGSPSLRVKKSHNDLRIKAFSNLTGYLKLTSPFCSVPPQPQTKYRLLASEDPQRQGMHNFFKAVVFRELKPDEPTSFGFVEPETFEEMVRIAYYGESDPIIRGVSLVHDLQHLRTVNQNVLESWLN